MLNSQNILFKTKKNIENTERQKTSSPKEQTENADVPKAILNKLKTIQQ